MGKKATLTYRYNDQISIDSENQIIADQHVSQQANDMQEVKPALESIEDSDGKLPEHISLDNDYMKGSNFETLDESKRQLAKAYFDYTKTKISLLAQVASNWWSSAKEKM